MQTLNSKLFDTRDPKLRLHEDVRNKLIEIANTFLEDVRDQGILIYPADIRIVGSNAGYDYTPYSDIDLHIVVNSEFYSCDPKILQTALNLFRFQFNDQYNITVKGIEVEVYAEDIKSATVSNGIYSIIQNRWIKYPQPEVDMSEYITPEIKDKASQWTSLIEEVIELAPSESLSAEDDLQRCEHLINRLYLMRKTGLETDGRLSEGNLIFKQVRNSGMLDALKAKRIQLKSFALTLESLRRS